jgi:hypothetical protein
LNGLRIQTNFLLSFPNCCFNDVIIIFIHFPTWKARSMLTLKEWTIWSVNNILWKGTIRCKH